MKKLLTSISLFSTAILYSADFDVELKTGSSMNLKEAAPQKALSFDDNLRIKAHTFTNNYTLYFDFPKGKYGLNNLTVFTDSSLGLSLYNQIGTLEFRGNFTKQSEIQSDKGKRNAEANLAIYPYYAESIVGLKFCNDVSLLDNATDRTSGLFLGAYTNSGDFRNKSFFKNVEIDGDLILRNHKFAVATFEGENAVIKGQVKFDKLTEDRMGILVLNHDKRPEANLLIQTLKVGGLVSLTENAGVVSTITDSQKFMDLKKGDVQNPNYPKGKKLVGDKIIRSGILEIIGKGGDFSGEIRDNFSDQDKRGQVSLIMNSPNEKQILRGKNTYTGSTIVKAGELVLSGSDLIEDLKIMGGTLSFLSANLEVKNLNWSSGGIIFDLSKNKSVNVLNKINVSAIPEALDTLSFKNITPRKAYTLISFKNKENALATFVGKKIEYTDTATNKVYTAMFGVSDTALTVVFLLKE